MQMHISIWHRFPSAWRIRFNISYSVGMLVITSFSFYTFKSFLSPSVLEGISTGYTILSWQFFFLSVLYRCCSLSSGCIVSYIKSVVVFSSMCLFFLTVFFVVVVYNNKHFLKTPTFLEQFQFHRQLSLRSGHF